MPEMGCTVRRVLSWLATMPSTGCSINTSFSGGRASYPPSSSSPGYDCQNKRHGDNMLWDYLPMLDQACVECLAATLATEQKLGKDEGP